ncbi:Uncharacterised protein [Bordetella pertussis]|nr:Uncharacterised protein [Bordetella pertussis]
MGLLMRRRSERISSKSASRRAATCSVSVSIRLTWACVHSSTMASRSRR